MEFDTDCVEYDLEYLRVVRRGTVRCCGVEWYCAALAGHEGQTVRVILRSRLKGDYAAVGTLKDEFIGLAERANRVEYQLAGV